MAVETREGQVVPPVPIDRSGGDYRTRHQPGRGQTPIINASYDRHTTITRVVASHVFQPVCRTADCDHPSRANFHRAPRMNTSQPTADQSDRPQTDSAGSTDNDRARPATTGDHLPSVAEPHLHRGDGTRGSPGDGGSGDRAPVEGDSRTGGRPAARTGGEVDSRHRRVYHCTSCGEANDSFQDPCRRCGGTVFRTGDTASRDTIFTPGAITVGVLATLAARLNPYVPR